MGSRRTTSGEVTTAALTGAGGVFFFESTYGQPGDEDHVLAMSFASGLPCCQITLAPTPSRAAIKRMAKGRNPDLTMDDQVLANWWSVFL